MQNPYSIFPEIESSDLLLRKIKEEDLPDLLKIYSDKEAAKFFNTDNCHGDDFFYRTIERVRQVLDFWNYSYLNKFFVRWAIVDKTSGVVIGTIEQFHRNSTEDPFTNCSLLRLDLRSDYEKEEMIKKILSTIIYESFDLFNCEMIVTKCFDGGVERRKALLSLGFIESKEPLIGHDKTKYNGYYCLSKK